MKDRLDWVQENKPHLLSIEDSQNDENDISKQSFAYGAVWHSFEHAFDVLRSAFIEYGAHEKRLEGNYHTFSLLGSIITLDDNVLRHRYYIQQTANI